jgi:hypothetical protein
MPLVSKQAQKENKRRAKIVLGFFQQLKEGNM